jgi:hypothetical protein
MDLMGNPNYPLSVVLDELTITYHVVNDGDYLLYSSQNPIAISNSGKTSNASGEFRTPVQPLLPGQQPPVVSGINDCVAKSCSIQKLLGHLNGNKRYYNSLLWLNEDANDRIARWSCCNDQEGNALSLISQIENEPITV